MPGAESEGDEGYVYVIIIINISTKNELVSQSEVITTYYGTHQSQSPRGLRRGSAVARLLELWVRIPPGERTCVFCECCVLSGLCDGLITRREDTYRVVCLNESDCDNDGGPAH